MALATYTDLQAAIASFLDRADLAATVPTFIALAEAQISRDVRHPLMDVRASAPFDAQYTALPDDWLETRRLSMGNVRQGYRALAITSPDDMERMRAERGDVAGTPLFYCHTANGIEVFPTPSSAFTDGELVYVAQIPALSASAPSNWLLRTAPDVYLYGSLIHSAPYLVADERLGVWQGLYASAVQALNAAGQRARTSGTSLRLRPPR